MTAKNFQLNESWLNGKYVIDNQNVEIDFSHSIFSVEGYRTIFFAQGEDADNIISEIHQIWLNENLTQSEAIQIWINAYL